MPYSFVVTLLCALSQVPPDTVVVCPPEYIAAMRPWVVHRSLQGHEIAFVTEWQSAADIRAAIRDVAEQTQLRDILVIGDAHAAMVAGKRPTTTPTCFVDARVNVLVGSEPEIATDNPYADFDNDGVPEAAIGRLPVDNPAELEHAIQRILDYENSNDFGLWRRQIDVVAGVGGFGAITDSVLEMATKQFLTDGIPADYNTSMTYASWRSPYCPDPRIFKQVMLERWNAGSLFWVYIGHGQTRCLDTVVVPGGAFPIMDVSDAARLQTLRGSPIALLLACYTGAFDQADDCLAEEMLRSDGGPVAAICGTHVTMPYAMAVLSDAMIDELFCGNSDTLGEVLLNAKQRAASEEPSGKRRQWLDLLASALSPMPDVLHEERMEHLAMLHLLGDPLLRIHQPLSAEVVVTERVQAGQELEFRGRSDVDGEVLVELVCRRDRTRLAHSNSKTFQPTERFLQGMTQRYIDANDPVWCRQKVLAENGEFHGKLAVPSQARGFSHVRIHVSDGRAFAIGSAPVYVRRADTTETLQVASQPNHDPNSGTTPSEQRR